MADITRTSRPDSWRRDFIQRHHGRCHYCNRPGVPPLGPDDRAWHVDHMTALARGGTDEEDNLVLACKRCNLTKSVQPYAQFAAFARAAFWVPDDWRASEYELDSLAEMHQGIANEHGTWTRNTSWHVDEDGGRIVMTDCENYDGNFIEPVIELGELLMGHLKGNGRFREEKRSAGNVLQLIADMHRLLPAMVAEIRMLRGEAAEQAKTDEAAA